MPLTTVITGYKKEYAGEILVTKKKESNYDLLWDFLDLIPDGARIYIEVRIY